MLKFFPIHFYFQIVFIVSTQEPIEPSLHQKFQSEKLFRTIKECDDLDILRGIALELLNLHQQKSAIAHWATKRAAKAEQNIMISKVFLDYD